MQVVSGPVGREKVHFEAPPATALPAETAAFLQWFNAAPVTPTSDPLVHAGLAHLWLVTLHPFDDGNGRISRAVGDMALARGVLRKLEGGGRNTGYELQARTV
jgi:Fic family protein